MAYRITLECGDKSVLRQKKTQDGFTHDWEVFVRGVDNAHIEHFIEKGKFIVINILLKLSFNVFMKSNKIAFE